ncbi:MAG: amidohydrolase family protein [Candidatus Solibacter usitatus]|nr:amidohydrolase family protein [Candidatus Solibacter usitatus]
MTRRDLVAGLLGTNVAAGVQAKRGKVIDAHNHLNFHNRPGWAEDDRKLIEAADKLGIDQLCCSILPPERPTTLEGFRLSNRWLAEAMGRFRGRVLGYCFVNPGYGQEAVDEVRRYVEEHGFIGVKLYNDFRVTDPKVAPIIELAARLRVPILHHAGHASWLPSPQPNISDAGDIARAASAHPETTFICAHICGGGDWEWSIKALRDARGVYFDTSGSVADEGTVELAVRTLGAERVLFACDLSMTASVGRVRGAEISEGDRRKVMGENMQRILARRGA